MNNQNYNAAVYSMKEIMAKQKQRKMQEDIGGLLMFISLMLLAYILLTLQGCTAGGQRLYCGWEEINQAKIVQGYDIPETKTKK